MVEGLFFDSDFLNFLSIRYLCRGLGVPCCHTSLSIVLALFIFDWTNIQLKFLKKKMQTFAPTN